ncbi:MAG: ChuX/HutX family heme-like substrate-binding protein [Chitinophagaceae bacterium]|jgi:putative hemin transport protein
MSNTIAPGLKEQYESIKASNPKMRIRNAAQELKVSEAQLVALSIGEGTTLLNPAFQEILKEIINLGEVMALTRNNSVVHERKGIYDNISFEGPIGLAVNKDIDLRLFMMHWKYAFTVSEGDRKSIQIFDKSGEAVHKVYVTPLSNVDAYEALVKKFTAEDQNAILTFDAYPAPAEELQDSSIDVDAFQEGWKNLKDTHEFFGLTRTHKLTRTQALRLAPAGFVQKVPNNSARKMLDLASERQVPIMVFVGNRGCIQIHSGTVNKVMEAGPWYNVLDPKFNLHLNETDIDSAFIVKKPSTDGDVTSLEIFDASGEMIVQFFGERKPGIPELETWRALVKDLPLA